MDSSTRRVIPVRMAALMIFTLALSACNQTAGNGSASPAGAAASAAPSAGADTLALSASTYAALQSAGSVSLSVVRTGAATAAVEIAYATADGTALAGTDYTATSGTLQWAENDSTPRTITVPVSNAQSFSGNKSFDVVLISPSAAAAIGSPGSAAVTISGAASGASAGSLELADTAYLVDQATGSATVTVNRSGGDSGAVSVTYATANGTAVAGTDYSAASGTLTWADGDATAKSFRVAVSNANPFSGDKSFVVTLTGAGGGAMVGSAASADVTIAGTSSPPVGILHLSASSQTVAQSTGSVTVTVDRIGGSYGAVTAAYFTIDGSAVAGTDYTAASGTLQWADGDSSAKTFSVPVSNAAPFSGNKTFTVALSSPSAGATISSPGSASVTITGDAAPTVGSLELSASSYTAAQSAGSVTVTVNRTGGSAGAVTVAYATANGTAVAGTDYTAASGTLQWADGDSSAKNFSVPVSNATPFAGSRSFSITLSAPTGGATLGSPSRATATITGGAASAAGSLQLSASSYNVAQSGGSVTVTVNRTGGSTGAVTVAYATANGTAVAGTDYTAASGTLQWAAGDAASKTFSVTVSNATAFSGSRSFTVALSNPAGGANLSAPSTANVTITGSIAAATLWVYYNGVFNWGGDWSWEATINYQDTAGKPLDGPYDIAVDVTSGTGGWQPYKNALCQSNLADCFDTSPYKYIVMALKPTVAGAVWAVGILSSGDTFDGSVGNIAQYATTAGCPTVGQWCNYKIPLSAFNLTDLNILKFNIQDQSGPAVFYVDDVGFTAN